MESAQTPPTEVTSVDVPGGALAAEPGLSLIAPDLLQVRTRFLTAEWSVGPDTAPAYPAGAVASFRAELDALVTVRPVPGVDHPASIMSPPGAQASAELINEALSGEAPA